MRLKEHAGDGWLTQRLLLHMLSARDCGVQAVSPSVLKGCSQALGGEQSCALSMDKSLCVSKGKFYWRPCSWMSACREPRLPATLKPYLVWLVSGRKRERKAPSSALARESTSLAPLGWLRLPTPRVEDVLPFPTPPSWWLPSPLGLPAWPAPAKGGAQGTLAHHWSEKVSMPLKRRWIFC